MSDELIDVRTPLATSRHARVEIGHDGVLHVLAGPVTLHLERAICEELTTTLARAMVALARSQPRERRPWLQIVADETDELAEAVARETYLPREEGRRHEG
jgi:hypothetical protein